MNTFADVVWETMESLRGSEAQWKSFHIVREVEECALPHNFVSSFGRYVHIVSPGID